MKVARYSVVMAVFPNVRGFAYVIFEDSIPVDWGMSDVRGLRRNQTCLRRVSKLLDHHEPDVLVLRGMTGTVIQRTRRIGKLIEAIEELAKGKAIITVQFSREQVREAFGHLERPTRYAIADAIAQHIPLFDSFVPPKRKIWQKEDRRMGLFDAAALALTHFQTDRDKLSAP